MKIIAGLGNPGSEYENTRHNAGFMTLDRLLARSSRGGEARWQAGHQALVAKVLLGGESCLLLKPLTFMNLSGRSVADAMRFFRVKLSDLLVVVDDVALPCGAIRLRPGGSSGGHNGLADIEQAVASLAAIEGVTGRDFARLRIGVDAPGQQPLAAYVLGRFTPEQKPLVDEALIRAAEAVECWACAGVLAAMARYNGVAEERQSSGPKQPPKAGGSRGGAKEPPRKIDG
ncbi:MAG: aminoacyl-tRNA hydrolase [Phycisphaerales bacterium]|nr:aminoacyl-tRNA hydrolase [Phycisphaerales bacterium]